MSLSKEEKDFRKWLLDNYGIQERNNYDGTQAEELAIQYAKHLTAEKDKQLSEAKEEIKRIEIARDGKKAALNHQITFTDELRAENARLTALLGAAEEQLKEANGFIRQYEFGDSQQIELCIAEFKRLKESYNALRAKQ